MTAIKWWLRSTKAKNYVDGKEACESQIQKWQNAGVDVSGKYYYWGSMRIDINSNDLNLAKLSFDDEEFKITK